MPEHTVAVCHAGHIEEVFKVILGKMQCYMADVWLGIQQDWGLFQINFAHRDANDINFANSLLKMNEHHIVFKGGGGGGNDIL